ncbi:hypothetical protein ACQKEI_05300 [Psychrobacter namhaensis]|uniref:hypothetical protein n=1 Tax=Psychrobacter namhaensis TaxID=292734 RepID=UPI003CFE8E77
MADLIINPDLKWSKFPDNQEAVLSQFNGYQTIVIAKIPKGIDEDFNQNGIYFGMISNPDEDYNGISLKTSHWDGCQDCYFPDEIYTVGSTYGSKEIPTRYDPITWHVTLEDITEFVIVERMKI